MRYACDTRAIRVRYQWVTSAIQVQHQCRELKRRIYRQYVTAAPELADLERAIDGGATGAGALRNWSAPLPPVDAAVPAQLLQPVTADGAKRPICACPVEST